MRVMLALLLCVTFVHAATVDTYIDISPEGIVHDHTIYLFANPYNGTILHHVDDQLRNISVWPNATVTANNDTRNTFLNITLNTSITELHITYERADIILNDERKHQFLTELDFNPNLVRNITAELRLPPGYGLVENDYLPENGIITSDGKNVLIKWAVDHPDEIPVILVTYERLVNKESSITAYAWILPTLLVLILFGVIAFIRKKSEKNLLRGFREDEQKTIEFIRGKGSIYQKELQKEFGFSRAKCTRIVKKLEQRKLIHKDSHGRTNKIDWIG